MAKNNSNANKWTTAEQREFLNARWPEYFQIYSSPKPKYSVFWAQLKESWFKVYPEMKHLFPHIASATDLSVDQEKDLLAAILTRVEQLKRWYQWKASSLAQYGGRTGHKKTKNKRALKPAEIYSKCGEYKLKVKQYTNELIEEMKIANHGKVPHGGILIAVKRASKELYNAESDEVKEKVLAMIQEQAKSKEEETINQKNRMPEQYLTAIQAARDYLNTHLDLLTEHTGWSFSVLMGGPHPAANGTITVGSFHKGLTPLGSDFGMNPDFVKNCMEPFTSFLKDVYPLSVRESRALIKKDSSEGDLSDSFSDGEIEFDTAPTRVIPNTMSSTSSTSSSESLPLAPVNQGVSALTASDADPVTGGTLTPSGAPKSNLTNALPSQLQTNNRKSTAETALGGESQPALNNFGNVSQGQDQHPDHYANVMAGGAPAWDGVPRSLHAVYNTTGQSTDSGSLITGGETNLFNFGSDVVDPFLKMDFSLNTMDEELYNSLDLFLRSHPVPTTEPYPNQLMLPPVNGDDSCRRPTDLFNFGPGLTNGAMANAQPIGSSLAAVAPVFSLGSSDLWGDVSMTNFVPEKPATCASQSSDVSTLLAVGLQASTTAPTVPSPPASAPTVHNTIHNSPAALLNDITQVDHAADNIQLNPADSHCSCSGRMVVPSKRAELLNMIGENSKVQASAKENISPSELPTWAVLVKAHLLLRNLGDNWKACVEEWSALEIKLGALPAIFLHPDEWTKWVGKSSQGNWRYDSIPFIADSAELGVAVVKWWHAMQPSFRQSADHMPSPTYVANDGSNWDALKKSGPNGLISVMTLIAWWGQALADCTPYQDDSTDMWRAIVLDVKASMEAIAAALSVPQKRKVTAGKENSAKRARSS